MTGTAGLLRIANDAEIAADIRNCNVLEIFGTLEGDIVASTVTVHKGGRLSGRVRANTMDVHGSVEGEVVVRERISINAGASVRGDVRYGRMVLDPDGDLTAKVKNVPPELTGDFSVSVRRGQHVVLTSEDIAAIDPDNTADELVYTVSDVRGGHVAVLPDVTRAAVHFTQADLNRSAVVFVHDGGADRQARFDVVVHDAEGASSGKPRTVDVTVLDAAAAA